MRLFLRKLFTYILCSKKLNEVNLVTTFQYLFNKLAVDFYMTYKVYIRSNESEIYQSLVKKLNYIFGEKIKYIFYQPTEKPFCSMIVND